MTDVTGGKEKREISSIAFPYVDLEDAISVANAMLSGGGVPMDRDQLAAAMGQVPTSGSFNMKVSAARQFGLVDNPQGKYQLTPLGFEILDGARERQARAEAFLNVPLYRRAYDTFKGRQLPPRPAGLENAFVDFGVSSKQKDKARQAFERSARLAGYFPSPAEDRLVQPVIGASAPSQDVAPPSETGGSAPTPMPVSVAAPKGGPDLHPFIVGLLDELPPKGQPWTLQDQADWLQGAAQIFRILYKGDGEIVVTVKKGGF